MLDADWGYAGAPPKPGQNNVRIGKQWQFRSDIVQDLARG